MGSGRAGWYAYDFIDNGGHHSAETVLPQFQNIGVRTVFPALPGVSDVFVVAQYQPSVASFFPGDCPMAVIRRLGRSSWSSISRVKRALS